jgi:hypothetical protein
MLSQSVVVEVDRELLEKIDGPTFPTDAKTPLPRREGSGRV